MDELDLRLSRSKTCSAALNRGDVEDRLQSSEAQYRLLFEADPQPMWVFDQQTLQFLAVNEAAVAQYGYSPDEFLSLTIIDIRPEQDRAKLLSTGTRPRTGLIVGSTWQHRRKNGDLIWVEITSHQVIFDRRPAELVLAKNVTKRKQAEAQLRVSKER